jgi:tellurite resistance protein
MAAKWQPPLVPAAFFAVVLGLAGLGSVWRRAAVVYQMPVIVGEVLMACAAAIWAVQMALYVLKWCLATDRALEEARHPVQCCFIGLAGVATMLIAGAVLPYSRLAAEVVFVPGLLFTVAFGVWRTGLLWHGERDEGFTTPVLYLPTVGGGFVTAAMLANLGFADWARMAFGAAVLSWLAIESVLLRRLYSGPVLPPPLRPTLGIQLAPPAVGAVAYLALTDGPPDLVLHMLFGYALLQGMLMLRLLKWISAQPFSMPYWGFSFGLTAIAQVPLGMVARGDHGAGADLAGVLFVLSNAGMLWLILGTLRLLLQGKILPAARIAPPHTSAP